MEEKKQLKDALKEKEQAAAQENTEKISTNMETSALPTRLSVS